MEEKEEKSVGRAFVDKLEAQEEGLGPNFVAKVEGEQPSFVAVVRARAGTATEGLKTQFSRLSQAVSEAVAEVPSVVQSVGENLGFVSSALNPSLANALSGVRAKDVAVPGAELVSINSSQKVGELEQLLRKEHIHSVPVWNGAKFEGSVDTSDLVTWAVAKFPKSALDAWTAFTQEREFSQQPVKNLMDASWRNHFFTTTPDADLLSVLEQFRDGRDVHRLFIRKADAQTGERDLVGVVTQSDILRWLNSATFEAKSTKIGELIHSKKVVSCFEDELVISALRLMDSALVSSVAVLDVHGKIVGVVSSFDLVGSSHESIISNLFKTLGKFVGRGVANVPVRLVTVRPNTSFQELLDKMVTNRVLHTFMVDDDGFPTRTITLHDILRALLPKQ